MRPRAHPWVLCALVVVAAVAGVHAAWADESDGNGVAVPDSILDVAPDFDTVLEQLPPMAADDVATLAWSLVPQLVQLDRPDLFVDFMIYWEDRCGRSEPLERARLLAAIWDGALDESLYDEEIIDHLADWSERDVSRLSGLRLGFDDFTVIFADQLLPHQPEGSLEEFFCLYYSGHSATAWQILAADPLADTWLRYYRDETVADLGRQDRPAAVLATVGRWRPRGEVSLAGEHVLVGLLLEQRFSPWFVRVPIEVRLGRTSRPYLVDQEEIRALSDRFDALYLGFEAGRTLWQIRALRVEVFAGLGYDGIRPFREHDIMLATLNGNLGTGLRWRLGGGRQCLGLDLRREWIGTRNEGPDSLAGSAWSLRLGIGWLFDNSPRRRLELLGG